MSASDDRARLLHFKSTDLLTPQIEQLDRWYKGQHFNLLPTKGELLSTGLASVLEGWRPADPIIHADTRVLALGSCFAAHFVRWLGDQGFNRRLEAPYRAILQSGFAFETTPVIAQQFRWAFGEVDRLNLFWVDPGKQMVEATEEGQQLLRSALENADVVIVTLGLSELWYDKVTGEPLWRAVPERYLDLNRHAFKVLSVAETVEQLEVIERIRVSYLPKLKIVYTVSPVRLRATFRPVSCLTANAASKAIIRAALDEFLRSRWEQVGRVYFYFPSYEIVTETFRDPYEEDARHIHEGTVQQVLNLFAEQYTSLVEPPHVRVPDESHTACADLLRRIDVLEAGARALQTICDERQAVIDELARAAQERLDVIHQLDARRRELEQVLASGRD